MERDEREIGRNFSTRWKEGVPVGANSLVRRAFSDECVLLREWAGSNAPIFFDFGEKEVLWWLLARSTNGPAYVAGSRVLSSSEVTVVRRQR